MESAKFGGSGGREYVIKCPAGQVISGVKARDSSTVVGSIDTVYCKDIFDIDDAALGTQMLVPKVGKQWGQQNTSICPAKSAVVGLDALVGEAIYHGDSGRVDNVKFKCGTRRLDFGLQSFNESWTRLFGLQPQTNVDYRKYLQQRGFTCDYYAGKYANGMTIYQQDDLNAIKMQCGDFKKQNDLLIGDATRRTYCCNNYDPTFCGPYKPSGPQCDSHMKWLCSTGNPSAPECACMNSEIPRPMCFDKRCTNSYQTADMRSRSCEGSYFDCKQYLTLSPDAKNNVLNNVQLEQNCTAKPTEVISQPPNGGPQTNPNDQSSVGGIPTGGDVEKPITLPLSPEIPISMPSIPSTPTVSTSSSMLKIYLLLFLIIVVAGALIHHVYFSQSDDVEYVAGI